MTGTDCNALECAAAKAIHEQRFSDAVRIYLFMGDGDPSLDAGYLAERLGQCYKSLNDTPAARFWYGRAVEENPEARAASATALRRLGPERYEDLLRL